MTLLTVYPTSLYPPQQEREVAEEKGGTVTFLADCI